MQTIDLYKAQLATNHRTIVDQLWQIISASLPMAQVRMYHGAPVWFIHDNPIVGVSVKKAGIEVLFWSGQSFTAPGLTPVGKHKAAGAIYSDATQINEAVLSAWLEQSKNIQWDYKNILKNRGELLPLRPSYPRVEIEVTVQASVEAAWHAYTQPEAIMAWNFASPDWCCPAAQNDLREGGRFNYRMEARDTSVGFDFTGSFTAVQPGKLLAYTMDDGRTVSTTFAQNSSGTVVHTSFDAEASNSIDLQRQGWQAILDSYKKFLTTLKQ